MKPKLLDECVYYFARAGDLFILGFVLVDFTGDFRAQRQTIFSHSTTKIAVKVCGRPAWSTTPFSVSIKPTHQMSTSSATSSNSARGSDTGNCVMSSVQTASA